MRGSFLNPSWMPHLRRRGGQRGRRHGGGSRLGPSVVAPLDALGQAAERRGTNASGPERRGRGVGLPAPARPAVAGADAGAAGGVRPGGRASSPSGVDNVYKWGMDCPDCIYTGASLRAGESYRVWGNRGSARYVGLQSMAGMASSANVLLDELDLGPDGEVELILSPEEHEGNWLPLAEDATNLVIRHFFYDWDTEVASSLSMERMAVRRWRVGVPRGAAAGRSPGGGGAPDHRARGLRRRQPRVLPPVLPARDAEHVPAAARRDRHGRRRGEPPGHRIVQLAPTRRCWSRCRRPRACTGATRWGTRGGRPSTTPATRAA